MIDRRQFVLAAGSVVGAAVAASLRSYAWAAAPPESDAGARLNALFDAFMDERLSKTPEQVTVLGLDKGKYASARSKLNDASLRRMHEVKSENAARLKRLEAFGRDGLHGADLANYDTVAYQMETLARTAPFDYGDQRGYIVPYVVSQLTGAYQSVPTFLDRQHQIHDKDDAESYLARLRAFAVVLDQESERVRHDAGLKVVPPDFLIDRTLEQMRVLRSPAAADSILSTSVATRAAKLGIPGDYGAQAARIVARQVYPALDRQMQAISALRAGTVHDAGVARLPQGAALYEVALRGSTTTDMTAEEVHQLGLEQARDLTARMDVLLRQQGKTSGTVAERAQALATDPQYLYPDTDDGSAADPRLLQRPHQSAAADPATVLPRHAEGSGGDPSRAGLHPGRGPRRLLPDPGARWLASRRLLHQSARYRRMVALEAADARATTSPSPATTSSSRRCSSCPRCR